MHQYWMKMIPNIFNISGVIVQLVYIVFNVLQRTIGCVRFLNNLWEI